MTVADTGPGVPPEDVERFSRFRQVEKDFTGQQDGMGLGLARAQGRQHGSAAFSLQLGPGATVLTLPAGP